MLADSEMKFIAGQIVSFDFADKLDFNDSVTRKN